MIKFGSFTLQRDNDYEIVIVALQIQIAKAACNWFYVSPSIQNVEIANIIRLVTKVHLIHASQNKQITVNSHRYI